MGEALLDPLDPVSPPCVVMLPLLPWLPVFPLLLPVELELLLCATANAPAATNTKRIPGNFFIMLSIVFKVLRSTSPPPPQRSRSGTGQVLNTSVAVINLRRECRQGGEEKHSNALCEVPTGELNPHTEEAAHHKVRTLPETRFASRARPLHDGAVFISPPDEYSRVSSRLPFLQCSSQ